MNVLKLLMITRGYQAILFTLCLLISTTRFFHLQAQQHSVLSQGRWVKMSFTEHGVYKIDRATLSSMGFDINTIDPRNIQIYGLPGGMLPQANSDYESLLLRQLAIQVHGEQDGQMGSDDYVLFYVDRVDRLSYDNSEYRVDKNLYSNEIYYFLTVAETVGKRLITSSNIQTSTAPITNYERIIHHEEELTNILGSGRQWYGEQLDTETPVSFDFDAGALSASGEVNVLFTGMAQSFSSSSFALALNGQQLGEINFSAIPEAQYGIKGNERSGRFTLNSSDLQTNPTLELSILFNKNGVSNALGFINRFTIELPSQLSYSGSPFNFRAKSSLDQSLSVYEISSSEEVEVWDVSNVLEPTSQESEFDGNHTSFGAFSDELHEYVAFSQNDLLLVENYETLANQDISGQNIPDLLIVTHESLLSQANRLAQFRTSHDGLEVLVVTIDQIYNEFSAGRQDISAIRNYARFLKLQDDQFRYLLLFGKGSYDYLDRFEDNTNLVPTYEARNSLHPLLSYSSDDYFGFLDEDEGQWIESSSGDHLLDIGIGRIPATTLEQATIAVDKIIAYQTNPQALGDWRSRLVFVADDGDNNIHQRDADFLATLIDTTYQNFNVTKIYLDAFNQELRPNGEFSPEAVNALLDEVDKGALIINFTGHGAETGWMHERVLTTNLIDDWDNSRNLPLLVTATCEFGRNDDPTIFSGAEKMIFKPDGGALGLITTARPVFSSSNYDLNLALYGSILDNSEGDYPRLGDVIQFTKNNSLNGSLNRNFILLGDPSMRIAYPKHEIQISTINERPLDQNEPDTIRALQHVVIEGAIISNSRTLADFNGTVNFSLLDKSSVQETKGTESPVFSFLQRNSTLFNGSASVENGLFSIEFVVPKNIDYRFGAGKMTMYATATNSLDDAIGATIDFVIGGTDTGFTADATAPEVMAFLNDTIPLNRYVVKPNADLVLLLRDENGINISKSGIGQNITATLNDSVVYSLNDFYSTRKDDFTKGIVRFPMRALPVGINHLQIKAWDTHNNLGTASLEFIVTDENSNELTEINAYPNPFRNNMSFAVAHNSAGESIEVVVEIFNQRGEKVSALYHTNSEAGNIEVIPWNGTDNTGSTLPRGVYIYNILLKSENNQMIRSARQKLIISN